jgi:hypothetical protein
MKVAQLRLQFESSLKFEIKKRKIIFCDAFLSLIAKSEMLGLLNKTFCVTLLTKFKKILWRKTS